MLGIDRSGVDFSGSVHCFSMKARVMYLRRTTTSLGREFQRAPVTIFSVFSFQRLSSAFRRADSKGLQDDVVFMASVGLPSQITVRQRSSSFVRPAVLGSLYPIASPNIAMPAVFASLASGVSRSAVGSHSGSRSIHTQCLTNNGDSGDSVVISNFAFSRKWMRKHLTSPQSYSYSQPVPSMARNTYTR